MTTILQTNPVITSAPVLPSSAWVSAAQLLAILAMSLEHFTKYVWPETPFLPWAIAIGRIAFPFFAGMVAWHLVYNTRRPAWYGFRLLLIGGISQLPYAFVVTPDQLNVCFTLALGLFAVVIMDRVKGRPYKIAIGFLLFFSAAAASSFVEYQILGLLLIPAFVYAFREGPKIANLLPVLALSATLNGGLPLYMAISFTAAGAVLLAPSVAFQNGAIPVIPRFLRLSWYPLHLCAVALITYA